MSEKNAKEGEGVLCVKHEDGSEGELWLDPRCSVLPVTKRGPYVRLGDGRLLVVGDNATFVSSDEGKTWSEPRTMCEGVTTGVPCRSGALMKTRDGAIILAYMDNSTIKWDWDSDSKTASEDTRLDVWTVRSLDDGETWVDRQRILDGYCGANNDIMQTTTGEIVVPVQDLSPDRTRHVQYTYVSADDGKTWCRSNMLDLGGCGHHDGAFEATVDELSDGRLLMIIRTSLDEFWQAFSSDKGLSWRILEPSGIDASNSPGHLVRLASGRLMLVWNRLYAKGQHSTRRTDYWPSLCEVPCSLERGEFSVSFSEDDANTWTEPVMFMKYSTNICYPNIFEYEPGELWISASGCAVPVKLNEADFLGGR